MEKDIINERIPEIDFNASYNKLTNLYQYEHGLFKAPVTHETYHNKYKFSINASAPIYTGGFLKAQENKTSVEARIQELRTSQTTKDVTLEIITHFLQIYHLNEQSKLIEHKIEEDSVSINEITSLKNNGLVTQNEVLRSHLQKSNHQLSLSTLQNDIKIAHHSLLTILSLPPNTKLQLDYTDLIKEFSDEYTGLIYQNNENIAIVQNEILKAEYDQKIVKSLELPTFTAVAGYNLDNPNYIFFPPQPYFYRLGYIGIEGHFSLSNLYKIKHKKSIAAKHLDLTEIHLEHEKEVLDHQIFSARQKLKEANDKIKISEQAIQQARENYQIVKSKYANQLSLISELIDADNVFLEAESNLISSQIDKQLKYFQLQYLLGNI